MSMNQLPPMSLHYRVYKISEMPFDDESALLHWLNERWVEKDALLERFYRYGILFANIGWRKKNATVLAPLRQA